MMHGPINVKNVTSTISLAAFRIWKSSGRHFTLHSVKLSKLSSLLFCIKSCLGIESVEYYCPIILPITVFTSYSPYSTSDYFPHPQSSIKCPCNIFSIISPFPRNILDFSIFSVHFLARSYQSLCFYLFTSLWLHFLQICTTVWLPLDWRL